MEAAQSIYYSGNSRSYSLLSFIDDVIGEMYRILFFFFFFRARISPVCSLDRGEKLMRRSSASKLQIQTSPWIVSRFLRWRIFARFNYVSNLEFWSQKLDFYVCLFLKVSFLAFTLHFYTYRSIYIFITLVFTKKKKNFDFHPQLDFYDKMFVCLLLKNLFPALKTSSFY